MGMENCAGLCANCELCVHTTSERAFHSHNTASTFRIRTFIKFFLVSSQFLLLVFTHYRRLLISFSVIRQFNHLYPGGTCVYVFAFVVHRQKSPLLMPEPFDKKQSGKIDKDTTRRCNVRTKGWEILLNRFTVSLFDWNNDCIAHNHLE